jgi:hypothetical protein
MNFFKRARTPEELVFKCCNAYEELVKPMPAKQAVRAALPLAARVALPLLPRTFGFSARQTRADSTSASAARVS